ncbi:MAG: hypothetical protein JWN48_759, partial [Myxococcaceae bacterium]|nr:hypothetical protein [Myxococcaceae bacterium]
KLIQRFCAAGGGCADAARRALIFGEGGDFDVETLRMRAALLDKVKVEIDLAHQSFEALAELLLRRAP